MANFETFIRELRKAEAQSWSTMTPGEYDREVCRMLKDIVEEFKPARRVDAVLMLASLSLRRKCSLLAESRACIAQELLAQCSGQEGMEVRLRSLQLFLLAWLHLGEVVANGPESMSVSPDLPPGTSLPTGADPEEIGDPELREMAQSAATLHRRTLERWRARQTALRHLNRLASFLDAKKGWMDAGLLQELTLSMSMAPGMPEDLRGRLESTSQGG
jgi:hypothetical protein